MKKIDSTNWKNRKESSKDRKDRKNIKNSNKQKNEKRRKHGFWIIEKKCMSMCQLICVKNASNCLNSKFQITSNIAFVT